MIAAALDPTRAAAGDPVPGLQVELTLQRLAMEAAANRDFNLIHLQPEAGRASGAPSAYANTTFVETLLELTLRQWAGLDARIRELSFAMRDFNCAGDRLRSGGAVTAVAAEEGWTVVTADLWIDGPRSRTVTGQGVVALPDASGAEPAA